MHLKNIELADRGSPLASQAWIGTSRILAMDDPPRAKISRENTRVNKKFMFAIRHPRNKLQVYEL
jgi:hypothetical protein